MPTQVIIDIERLTDAQIEILWKLVRTEPARTPAGMPVVSWATLIGLVTGLVDEPGTNREYERALVDLLTDVWGNIIGGSDDRRSMVLDALGWGDPARLRQSQGEEYARGYEAGRERVRMETTDALPISDVDGLIKAAWTVCDAAQGNTYSKDARLIPNTAWNALCNASAWTSEAARARREAGWVKPREHPLATEPIQWNFDEPTPLDAFSKREAAEEVVKREYEDVVGEYGFACTIFGYIGSDVVERYFEQGVKVKVTQSDERSDILRHDCWETGIGCIDPYWNVEVVDLPAADKFGYSTEGMTSCWIAGKTALYVEPKTKLPETPPCAPNGVVAELDAAAAALRSGPRLPVLSAPAKATIEKFLDMADKVGETSWGEAAYETNVASANAANRAELPDDERGAASVVAVRDALEPKGRRFVITEIDSGWYEISDVHNGYRSYIDGFHDARKDFIDDVCAMLNDGRVTPPAGRFEFVNIYPAAKPVEGGPERTYPTLRLRRRLPDSLVLLPIVPPISETLGRK